MNRRTIWALCMIVAFGAVRLPFEYRLEARRKAAYFHGAKFDLNLHSQIGQTAFLAALSGFRAPIADGFYLNAHALWEKIQWGRMKLNFDAATALQPRCSLFWEQASWHMAFNASIAAIEDKKGQPREALRIKAQRDYWKVGEDYLTRGIAANPDNPRLFDQLGFLYREKFKDHCKSSEIYDRGAALPNAMVYMHRFAAYELAQCPGHEREAYERLKALYLKGEDEQLPTLITWLRNLQDKLEIPEEQRIKLPPPSQPGRK